MTSALENMEQAVASLTAQGQPFALDEVELDGHTYTNFAGLPANLGEYYKIMLGHADKDFTVYREERYTYAEGYQRSAEFARALIEDFGVKKGDRVAILMRNTPQWMMAYIAATAIGAVVVPMNAWWTSEELEYGFGDCGAKVVLADERRAHLLEPLVGPMGLAVITVDDCSSVGYQHTPFAEAIAPHAGADMPEVEVAPDDYASIMYTSGSTGHPKGVLSSHRGILSALMSWMLMGTAGKMAEPVPASEGESFPPSGLLTIPLFHCTGSHSAFLLSLIVGRKIVIMHKWDVEEAMRLIEAERITWMTGVPTMSAELQAAAPNSTRDLSSLKELFSGGAARPPDQVGKIAKTFKGSSVGSGYGLTETNALGAVNSGAFYLEKPTSTGRAVPAVTEFKIIDEAGKAVASGERGEVCIKSTANALGYWNKPEATAEVFVGDWFHTGDVGYMDEDGFLYIVDRIKDIIIRGGENISCIEVEAALYAIDGVEEVAVFGLPDERLGEIVGAAVVPREGAVLDADTLQAELRHHLAGFKIPGHIWLRDEQLPRIASGKIFKRQLKADYAAELAG
jgi:acyl-CoA synthetase (AMP-forming)/AMP-acid ligase II